MTGQPSRSSTPLDRHSSLGVFPNDAALLLRLAGAVLIEAHDEWLDRPPLPLPGILELVLADEPATKEATRLTQP